LWKQRYLVDDTQDDIIFGEDEEIHENIKLERQITALRSLVEEMLRGMAPSVQNDWGRELMEKARGLLNA
jgi:hypothetical protein